MIPASGARVLAIGAHPDDIELGAGGFIYKLIKRHQAHVEFLILTHGTQHRDPAVHYDSTHRRRESVMAAELLGVSSAHVHNCDFLDCGLHAVGHEIIRTIERHLAAAAKPFDLVLTHSGADTHADHRETHEATISAVRDFMGTVMLYPAPSTKPHAFHPNFFAALDRDAMDQKHFALQAHASQRDKAFMKHVRTFGIASSWMQFLRVELEYVEPFEIYKSFW